MDLQTLAMILNEKFNQLVAEALHVSYAEIGEGIAWDQYSVQAATLSYQMTYGMISGIDSVTANHMGRIMAEWIESREPLKELVRRIDEAGLFSRERAKRIAVTESTRVQNLAMSIYGDQIGAEGKKWFTAVDELVCDICRPLHNEIVPAKNLFPPDMIPLPPAHPNCRCNVRPVLEIRQDDTGKWREYRDYDTLKKQTGLNVKPEVADKVLKERRKVSGANVSEAEFANLSEIPFKKFGESKYGSSLTDIAKIRLKRVLNEEIAKRSNYPESIISIITHQWAETSNDSSIFSFLIQTRASALYGVGLSTWQIKNRAWTYRSFVGEKKSVLQKVNRLITERPRPDYRRLVKLIRASGNGQMAEFGRFFEVWVNNQEGLAEKILESAESAEKAMNQCFKYWRKAIDAYLIHAHDYTVEVLKQIYKTDYVYAMRGVTLDDEALAKLREAKRLGKPIKYNGNAIESWTVDYDVARLSYFGGSAVLRAKIPIERIATTCYSGFGCYNEYEIVAMMGQDAGEVEVYWVRD